MIIIVNFSANQNYQININSIPQNQTIIANIFNWPKVSDQIRGYFERVNGNLWQPVPKPISEKNIKRLALIIESPHKDEFDNIFNPLCPLSGKSGKKYADFICDKWFNIPNNDDIDIIEIKIFNPVQYQTSLYHFLNGKIEYNNYGNYNYKKLDKNLRNQVWKFLFINCNLLNDFTIRINNYNPDYIVNCCTGTTNNSLSKFKNSNKKTRYYKKSKNLKAHVRHVILSTLQNQKNVQYLEDAHPCSW